MEMVTESPAQRFIDSVGSLTDEQIESLTHVQLVHYLKGVRDAVARVTPPATEVTADPDGKADDDSSGLINLDSLTESGWVR